MGWPWHEGRGVPEVVESPCEWHAAGKTELPCLWAVKWGSVGVRAALSRAEPRFPGGLRPRG